jgi:CDP-6-deoxy-D-xylo-4-hexulose-3-dehydrase
MECLVNWGRACDCLPGQSNTCGHRFDIEKLGIYDMPPGWDHKYTFSKLGYNLKMTEFQAALGMSQLTHLGEFVIIRQNNYDYYTDYFREYVKYFDLIHVSANSSPSPFGFPIIVKKDAPFTAQEMIAYFEENKIRTRRFFGGNLTRQPFIKDLPYISKELPNTDYIMESGFWIGVHPQITHNHRAYVLEIADKFFEGKGVK